MECNTNFSAAIAMEGSAGDPVLFQGDLLGSAAILHELGVNAMELHLADSSLLDCPGLTSFCSQTGMKLSALATGLARRRDHLTLIHESKQIRDEAVSRILGFIRTAAAIGASNVILGSIRGDIPDKSNRSLEDLHFYEGLSTILDYAGQKQVTVLIEVINRYENNYLNTTEEAMEYLAPLDSPFLKIHLDTFHMNIEENDMEAAIALCGPRLGYIHLADNTRQYVGSGTIDFAKVIRAAQKTGYQGWYSLECLPVPDGRTAIANTLTTLRSLY